MPLTLTRRWSTALIPLFVLLVAGTAVAGSAVAGVPRLPLFDARTAAGPPTAVRLLEPGHGPLFALAFSPDGTRLASASFDGRVRLWRLPPRLLRR